MQPTDHSAYAGERGGMNELIPQPEEWESIEDALQAAAAMVLLTLIWIALAVALVVHHRYSWH